MARGELAEAALAKAAELKPDEFMDPQPLPILPVLAVVLTGYAYVLASG
jgi:hypothetical protein